MTALPDRSKGHAASQVTRVCPAMLDIYCRAETERDAHIGVTALQQQPAAGESALLARAARHGHIRNAHAAAAAACCNRERTWTVIDKFSRS